MSAVNKVILVGNVGWDPETRYAPDGAAITRASLATTDRWRNRQSGETKESTECHRVCLFGWLAEIAGEHFKKGSAVYEECNLRTWKRQDEQRKNRYTIKIFAEGMQLLGSRGAASAAKPFMGA